MGAVLAAAGAASPTLSLEHADDAADDEEKGDGENEDDDEGLHGATDLQEQGAELEDECGDHPGEAYGVGHGKEGPAPAAALVLDGYDGGEAGHI